MVWMITLEEKYCKAILDGRKKIEVRTRIPKALAAGDTIVVCMKGTHGLVPFYFIVDSIANCSPRIFWERNGHLLAMDNVEYFSYTAGRDAVYGLRIRKVFKYAAELTILDFWVHKVPQWFTVVPCPKNSMILGSGKGD